MLIVSCRILNGETLYMFFLCKLVFELYESPKKNILIILITKKFEIIDFSDTETLEVQINLSLICTLGARAELSKNLDIHILMY